MKVKYLLAILSFIAFFGVNLFLYVKGRNELVKSNFSGTIEMITYDEKSIADVYVMGEKHHLTLLGNRFKRDVKPGDIIEKKTGIASYTIKKATTGKTINFSF